MHGGLIQIGTLLVRLAGGDGSLESFSLAPFRFGQLRENESAMQQPITTNSDHHMFDAPYCVPSYIMATIGRGCPFSHSVFAHLLFHVSFFTNCFCNSFNFYHLLYSISAVVFLLRSEARPLALPPVQAIPSRLQAGPSLTVYSRAAIIRLR